MARAGSERVTYIPNALAQVRCRAWHVVPHGVNISNSFQPMNVFPLSIVRYNLMHREVTCWLTD